MVGRRETILGADDSRLDVRHVLPIIRVPTLVLNRTEDRNSLIEEARYIAQQIPGAIMPELLGDNHLPWEGDQEALFAEIEQFVVKPRGPVVGDEPDTVLATAVAIEADSVGPVTIGAMSDRFTEHYRGRSVTTTDRGLVAVFDGPARALRYANAIGDAAASVGAAVRCGVQTGELELDAEGASGPPWIPRGRWPSSRRRDNCLPPAPSASWWRAPVFGLSLPPSQSRIRCLTCRNLWSSIARAWRSPFSAMRLPDSIPAMAGHGQRETAFTEERARSAFARPPERPAWCPYASTDHRGWSLGGAASRRSTQPGRRFGAPAR